MIDNAAGCGGLAAHLSVSVRSSDQSTGFMFLMIHGQGQEMILAPSLIV